MASDPQNPGSLGNNAAEMALTPGAAGKAGAGKAGAGAKATQSPAGSSAARSQSMQGTAGADDAAQSSHSDPTAHVLANSLHDTHPVFYWMTMLGPFIITLATLLYIGLFTEFPVLKLAGNAVVTFFLFGRFAIAGLGSDQANAIQMSPEQLFAMVLFMDVMVAMLLSCHLWVLFKVPFMGPKVEELVVDGQYILEKQPWMRKYTYVGIVAFVMFPLAATGSVGGSIFGRLLGLSRISTFLCVLVGSIMGCGAMYFAGKPIRAFTEEHGWIAKIGGLLIIVAIIFILNNRYQKMKSLHLAERMGAAASSSADSAPSDQAGESSDA